MAVKNAEEKKKALTAIMKLMDKMSGNRLAPPQPQSMDSTPDDEGEHETESLPGPTAPAQTDDDDEEAPSDDELDRMQAVLAKHRK